MMHLDKCFPDPPLQPQGNDNKRVMQLLENQDAYHMDIRNLTFRYILPNPVVLYKCKATLAKMDAEDAKGVKDVIAVGQGLQLSLILSTYGYTRASIEPALRYLPTLSSASRSRSPTGFL